MTHKQKYIKEIKRLMKNRFEKGKLWFHCPLCNVIPTVCAGCPNHIFGDTKGCASDSQTYQETKCLPLNIKHPRYLFWKEAGNPASF